MIYISEYIVINGELYHHGILGQKWGVRRYQNEDGTLTERGKKRYIKDVNNMNKAFGKANKYASKEIKKSEKSDRYRRLADYYHAKDVDRATRIRRRRSINTEKSMNKYITKAALTNDPDKQAKYDKKAALRAQQKAKIDLEMNKIAAKVPYRKRALKYSIKSDKLNLAAARAKYKYTKKKNYAERLNRSISTIDRSDIIAGSEILENMLTKAERPRYK